MFAKTPISTFLVRDSAEYPLTAPVVSEYEPNRTRHSEEVDAEGVKESDAIWEKMQPVVVKTIRTSDSHAPKKKKQKTTSVVDG